MRKMSWIFGALALMLSFAAAAEPANQPAPDKGCGVSLASLFPDEVATPGLEEAELATLFTPQAQDAALPVCPQPTQCPTTCPPATFCALTVLGQCCQNGTAIRCCPAGQQLQVIICPCTGGCTGSRVTLACV